MQWYRGKKVVVTGGSSGIGRAVALLLARAGADVGIVARDQGRLDKTLQELQNAGRSKQRFAAYSVDVRDREGVKAMAANAVEELGGIDVLIVNQGYAVTGYIQDMETQAFYDMMETNYFGHVHVTRAFLPHMIEKRSGHVCLVSSMLGFFGFFGFSAYAASKHAIAGFARCLRNELLPHNIQVSLVYPPTTDTPGLSKENEDKVPEAWAIEEGSQAMSADAVAKSMLEAIKKGRFETVPGLGNWAIWMAYRFAPRLVETVVDYDLKSFLRKRKK